MIEARAGSSFATASFSGNYLGGSVPLVDTAVLNEAGIVAADGAGNVLLTTNRSGPQGLVQYQNVAGTYTVDGTGSRGGDDAGRRDEDLLYRIADESSLFDE